MDYGRILSRALTIAWTHKWLILLGLLVALGSPGISGVPSVEMPWPPYRFDLRIPEFDPDLWLPPLEWVPPGFGLLVVGVLIVGLVLAALWAVGGVVLWIVATITRGGLIAGVNAVDGGEATSFGEAWLAGWRKGWRLVGIGVVPAIANLILAVVILSALGVLAGSWFVLGNRAALVPGAGLVALWAMLACILVPLTLALNLLQAFANRACVLEDVGVFAAYGRGIEVLVDHIGPALLLFLLQVGITVVLGVVLAGPQMVVGMCRILWPLLLLVQGAIATYFSTMWTLAWREWTGLGHVDEGAPAGGAAGEG